MGNNKYLLGVDARSVLAYVVRRVLSMNIVDYVDIYEYVEPLTPKELESILSSLLEGRVKFTKRPMKIPRTVTTGEVLVSNVIVHNVKDFLGLIEELIVLGVRPIVITASRPWVDVKDIEKAYETYQTYWLVLSKLSKLGVKVVRWSSSVERKV